MGYQGKREPMMLAPGASQGARSVRFPGANEATTNEWPSVDEHLVEPEISRAEIIRGRRMEALPALAPHGDMHAHLSVVVGQFVAADFVASTDLQTRYGEKSDFATDVCVRRKGTDPATDARFLEEVCFEVVYTQSKSDITSRAEDVIARGVRRIFAIFVKGIGSGEKAVLDETATVVREWSSGQRQWVDMAVDDVIEDVCFVRSLPVRAVIDAAAADDEIVRALRAKGNRALAKMNDDAFRDGRVQTLHMAIDHLLELHGLHLGAAQQARLDACTDTELLQAWFECVAGGETPEELTS